MAKIHFIDHDGNERVVNAMIGSSVMIAAISNGVPEIDADCGGACACATCHVYVDEQWLDKLDPLFEMEDEMLETVSERKPNSRLSCQIEVTDELDGLVVTTPEYQF